MHPSGSSGNVGDGMGVKVAVPAVVSGAVVGVAVQFRKPGVVPNSV